MKSKTVLNNLYFLFILAGDALTFLASLALALYVRHGFHLPSELWETHRIPFLILFVIWLFLLMLGDFYDPRKTILHTSSLRNLTVVFAIWIFLSLGFFYFSPFFKITPKIILLIDSIILLLLFIAWRVLSGRIISPDPVKFAVLGNHPQIEELLAELQKKINKNYQCVLWIKNINEKLSLKTFQEKGAELIIPCEEKAYKIWGNFPLRELINTKIKIKNFSSFFEEVTKKIPVQTIDSGWFLENFDETNKHLYDHLKRILDILGVLILALPAVFISALIIPALAIERKTKILYSQTRIKKGGKIFTIYKFGSMTKDAESQGPQWSTEKDPRATVVGRVIRRFHFDEIPQFWNILKGEMSFIGPRPERPEFVEMLEKNIPFYFQRFLVKPGLSGWAQINYPYGETVEDALRKLQYELYYIKHRSLLLDLEIFLRSFRLVLFNPAK